MALVRAEGAEGRNSPRNLVIAKEPSNHLVDGFSKRYGCVLLVWFEVHATMEYAITREKQLKAGSRSKKRALIEEQNPDWQDLYPSLH